MLAAVRNRARRVAGAVSVATTAVLFAQSAWADIATQLLYTRDPSVDDCPDESVVRAAVTQRLGYDPFVPSARSSVTFDVAKDGTAFVVRVERIAESGASLGVRKLRSQSESCSALVEAAALSLSIALDPVAAKKLANGNLDKVPPADVPPPPPPSAADLLALAAPQPISLTPSVDVSKAAPAPAPASTRFGWHAGAFLHASTGTAPSTAGGFVVGGGIDGRRFSLDLEARYDADAGQSVQSGGSVESSLFTGAIVPCAHFGPVATCALASLGRLDASSAGVTDARTKNALYASLGIRAAVEAPVTEQLALVLQGDVGGNLARTTLDLNGVGVWHAPPLFGTLGAGAVMRFR